MENYLTIILVFIIAVLTVLSIKLFGMLKSTKNTLNASYEVKNYLDERISELSKELVFTKNLNEVLNRRIKGLSEKLNFPRSADGRFIKKNARLVVAYKAIRTMYDNNNQVIFIKDKDYKILLVSPLTLLGEYDQKYVVNTSDFIKVY
jgi:hypothetical protein